MIEGAKSVADSIVAYFAILAVWVRLEVGQALNRAAVKTAKEQRLEDREQIRDALKGIHDDLSSLRSEIGELLRERRNGGR